MRIHLVRPDQVEPTSHRTFITPTPVDRWRAFMGTVLATDPRYGDYRTNLISNISHRLQYLEFLAATLLHDNECRQNHASSTLHETIRRQKIQIHCVITNSLFEGIGSYQHRTSQPQQMNPANQVNFYPWRDALAVQITALTNQDGTYEAQLKTRIDQINTLRGEVHIDSLHLGEEIHFNVFDGVRFLEHHNLLREILQAHAVPADVQNSVVFEVL